MKWHIGNYFLFSNEYHFLIGKITDIKKKKRIHVNFYYKVLWYRGIDKDDDYPYEFNRDSLIDTEAIILKELDLEIFDKDKMMVEQI